MTYISRKVCPVVGVAVVDAVESVKATFRGLELVLAEAEMPLFAME